MERNQSIKLVDKNYRLRQSKNYHLNIKLTAHSFSYQVFDPRQQKFLALFDVRRDDAELDFIPYAQEDDLLKQAFQKIRVMFSGVHHVLIPEKLYSEKDRDLYAGTVFSGKAGRNNTGPAGEPDGNTQLVLNKIPALKACFLSALGKEWSATLSAQFAGAVLFHEGCPYITGLLDRFADKTGGSQAKSGRRKADTCLCLKVELNYVEIAFISKGKLFFYNRFTYENDEQFIYFPLFVCEQLGIDPHEVRVLIYGLIDKSSEKYQLVYTYFKHLDFGELPGRFRYSKELYELPQHYFFSLTSLELCG